MECQKVKEKIFQYFDRELSSQEEKALFTHLRLCQDCNLEFESLKETHQLLQKVLIPVTPPLDLTERIMAQIPESLGEKPDSELYQKEVLGWKERASQYLAGFRGKWRNGPGGWQLKTAAVTLGLLAVVLWGNLSNIPGTQTVKEQEPDPRVAYVNPETTIQVPDKTHGQEPKVSTPKTPSQTGSGAVKENDQEKKGATNPHKETSQKPEGTKVNPGSTKPGQHIASSTDTNVVQLPDPASDQKYEATIEVTQLAQNVQNLSQPVLSDGGKYLHYLVSSNNGDEEWELELKPDAVPQVARSTIILGNKERRQSSAKVPEWLKNIEVVKGAKSKVVAWSGDNKKIAVNLRSADQDSTGLWIAQADGSTLVQVAQAGGGNDLAWSPDGTKVAFTDQSDNLYVLYFNLTDNLLFPVTDSEGNLRQLNHLIWTPDSKELIFEAQKKADDLSGIYHIILP